MVVPQGSIGFAYEKGQPVLLPPGLHQWQSPTMIFDRLYDLNNNVIRMGPLTLVTVDEGYSAVTEDNGRQVILSGLSTTLGMHPCETLIHTFKINDFASNDHQVARPIS